MILSKGILCLLMASFINNLTLAQDPGEPLPKNSRILFQNYCGRCHGIEGAGGTGPDLRRSNLPRAPDDESLAAIIAWGIGGTGMPGTWMLDESQINDIIAYVRYLGSQVQEPVTGDSDLGKLVYEKSGCAACHIVAGEGIGLGPELTRISQLRGPGYLTRAIRHPGLEKPTDWEGFISYLVVNVDDGTREVTGIRINEDSFTLQIKDNSNRYYTFRKTDIKSITYQMDESLMPSFDETLSDSEIQDLVAFLFSQGQ